MFPGVSEKLLSVAAFSSMFKYVPTVFRFIHWALAKHRISAIIACYFNFIFEIIWSSHFSSKLARSGKNSVSVWGKTCYLEFLNTRDDFYGFIVIIRNNDSVCWEDRATEQIIFNTMKCICINFSNWFGIISMRHLSPNFTWRLSKSSGRNA
jgi:hypothetical protein